MSVNRIKTFYCLLLASILSCSFIASAYTSSEINSEIESSENVDSYDPDSSKVDDSSDSDPGTSGSTGGTSTKDGDTGGTNDSGPDDDDDSPFDFPEGFQPGDIIFMDKNIGENGLIPGKEGKDHVAMYYGNGKIIQASTGGVKIFDFIELKSPPFSYDLSKFKYGYVKNINDNQRQNALDFALRQLGSDYQLEFFTMMFSGGTIKHYNPNEGYLASRWYCSELVWAAYYNCYNPFPNIEPTDGYVYGEGIDIDKNGWSSKYGNVPRVWPEEIYNDPDVVIYEGKNNDFTPTSLEINSNYQAGWNAAVQALLDAGYSDAADYLNNEDSGQSSSSSDSSESTDSDTSTGGTSSSSGDSDYDSMPQDYGDGDDDDGGSGSVDNDNDGYDSSVDCDDNDADVHPGAVELLDGKDNDCDGSVDEGSFVLTLDKSSVKRGGSFTATVKFNGNPASGVSVTFHKLVDRTKSTGSSGKVTFNVPVLCTLGSHSVDADRYGKSDSASITVERMW